MTIHLGTLERTHPRAGLIRLPEVSLAVPAEDLWSVAIVGQPGFGKSTFLGNLAEAFADEGEGVLLLDIKGDLAESIAARTKHPERVIYLDPAAAKGVDRYYTLNPLEFDRTDPLNFERYANALFETFIYMGEVAPEVMKTIRKVMKEAIRLALARRATTITDLHLALHDDAHRHYLLSAPGVPPQSLHYWTEVFPSSDRDQRFAVDSTDSRLREITDGPYLSHMLNQPKGNLPLVEWLDAGKLILCNLDQGQLSPSTAKRIGNLFLGYLAGEIVKRPKGQTASRWRIIVDEAHELATLPFAQMVTQMRTYNAFPVIATQNRAQLSRNTELLAAADQVSARFELMLAERDLAELRWTRTEAQQQEARERKPFTACYVLTRHPSEVEPEGVLTLRPWHGEPIPGQLERLRHEGIERATPKGQLRTLYDFDAYVRAREKIESNDPTPPKRPGKGKAKANAAGPVASDAGAGPKAAARRDSARRPDPGAARSDRVADRPPDRPPLLHRPYHGRPQGRDGAGSVNPGGQPEPAAAEGSGLGATGAGLSDADPDQAAGR
jgi:hypothetical protein